MGKLLAARHRESATPDPARSLVNYAESARAGDWTMRSALVRLAQPEPMRASATVELIRRLDTALHPVARSLERHTTICDRQLSPEALSRHDDEWVLTEPAEPVPDGRVVDLARLSRLDPGFAALVAASYTDVEELSDDEQAALPLLAVAARLDELADVLTAWASRGFRDPPVDAVDGTGREVFEALESLGVPRESRRPTRRRGSGASTAQA